MYNMGHLITAEGAALDIADGLGVSPLVLQPGDVFVQRHRFAVSPEETSLWLRTGIYWLDTMENWEADSTNTANALFVLLGLNQ